MNERKNVVHASLMAEHRRLLQEHNQVRDRTAAQAAELRGLRGEAFPCLLFVSLASSSPFSVYAKILHGLGAATAQADPAEVQALRHELDQVRKVLEDRDSCSELTDLV